VIAQEARLTVRLQRFELFTFGAALVALVIAGFAGSAYVNALRPGPECLGIDGDAPAVCSVALRAWDSAQQAIGGLIFSPTLIVAYVVGGFFGVPIVGRELERGTTRLAWSLTPSRWRWFGARVIPILLILIVLTFAAGVAVDQFFGATVQGEDPAASFTLFGARGGLLASRAAFIFAIAVLVGAAIGRALPALILSALVASVAVGGGEVVHQNVILRNEATPFPFDMQAESDPYAGRGDLYIDTAFQLPDGSLVGYEYFGDEDPFDANGNPRYPMFSLRMPGSQYRFVEAREALALGVGTLVTLLLAGLLVGRRRPG
jgi:hypothetical protein